MKLTRSSLTSQLLALLCLFLISGCGDSANSNDNPAYSEAPPVGRVAHVNWSTYNLYSYQEGVWVPIISRGAIIDEFPIIGDRPSIILHGLGSDIRSGRFDNVADGLVASGSSAVFGFEYDSLDSIAKNGGYFFEALTTLTEESPNTDWRIAGHSMGALVARVALENEVPLDVAEGSRAVLIAGPHTGSEVADEIQDRGDVVGEALGDLILNGRLEFRNVDGSLVNVTGDEEGFTDLRLGSQFLQAQNFEAANHHPQFPYLTLAGNDRGDDYEALNRVLGVFADDGVVNIDSANAPVIGAINSEVLPYDHSTIAEAPEAVAAILTFMGF